MSFSKNVIARDEIPVQSQDRVGICSAISTQTWISLPNLKEIAISAFGRLTITKKQKRRPFLEKLLLQFFLLPVPR